MSSLFSHLGQSLRRPDHWLYGSWLDTVVRYRKTRLGIAWLLIPTAVYIWGIGGFLASMQTGVDKARYFAHVGIGFAVFRFMATVMIDASTVFTGYQGYILDGQLRLTDFVLRNLARSFHYLLISLPVVGAVVVASPDFAPAGLPLSLLGGAVLLVNMFNFSALLAIAGAKFPDLHEIMSSVMMAAFLVTPIVWYDGAVQRDSAQGMLIEINPFHHLLHLIRAPILGDQVAASTYAYLLATTVLGAVAAAVIYRRAARHVPIWL